MNATQAQTFDGYSVTNAAILQGVAAARGCTCEPYQDFFTYQRWLAQGFQVRKGEHSTRLAVFVAVSKRDPDTGETQIVGKRPFTAHVFCRHQVDPR